MELPTIDKYVGHFYNATQIEKLFKIFEGDPAEFGVIAASFYGLRRSEVLGLRWDAIDFENKTITIRHTVNEARIDGKCTLVMADTTKTKSSFRTLPLVAPFEEMLHKMKKEQEENKRLCGNCYCQDYIGYIYVNEIGEIIKPGFLTSHFASVLKANNMPRIRFHDLRHPYVKPTTKKFASFLKFFRAAAIAARSCSIRYSWLMLPFQISPFLKSPA